MTENIKSNIRKLQHADTEGKNKKRTAKWNRKRGPRQGDASGPHALTHLQAAEGSLYSALCTVNLSSVLSTISSDITEEHNRSVEIFSSEVRVFYMKIENRSIKHLFIIMIVFWIHRIIISNILFVFFFHFVKSKLRYYKELWLYIIWIV